jgi:hypothetical protein
VLDLPDPGGGDRIEELRLGDDDAVAGVAEQVGDLLRRRRVVDRERGCSEVHRGAVAEIELGAVQHHDPDRVAAPNAEPVQAGGDRADPLRVLGEGELDGAARSSERDLLSVVLDRQLKGLAGSLRLEGTRLVGAGRCRSGLHLIPFGRYSWSVAKVSHASIDPCS